jgi:hypothetical protein
MNYIFYHCFTKNDYRKRFTRTFDKIKQFGLLEKTEKVFLCLNGAFDQSLKIDDKVELKHLGEFHPNESLTINFIRKFCSENPDSNILYLHSKGVTKGHNPPVSHWIDFMEFFLIEKHEDCILDLNAFDAVGVNMKQTPRLHFSGNFWWSNSNYISKLDECQDEYFSPEMWILNKIQSDKVKCYFDTPKDLYYHQLKRSEYTNE